MEQELTIDVLERFEEEVSESGKKVLLILPFTYTLYFLFLAFDLNGLYNSMLHYTQFYFGAFRNLAVLFWSVSTVSLFSLISV